MPRCRRTTDRTRSTPSSSMAKAKILLKGANVDLRRVISLICSIRCVRTLNSHAACGLAILGSECDGQAVRYELIKGRSEEHTSELQSHLNLVSRLLLESEEHTSELQSHLNLVCRLLLGSKKHTSQLKLHFNLLCRLLHVIK